MQNRTANGIGIAEKVTFLSASATYGPNCPDVTAIETHMAWVFLAGDLAFKIKKPVRYPFLDFSTPRRRQRTCRDEVRLNRRLAPDVYLDVVPLTREADGTLAIGGDGPAIDWLVKMRRLPEPQMLDQVIGAGRLTRRDIDGVSTVLADFYRRSAPVELPAGAYSARFHSEHEVNRRVIRDAGFSRLAEPFADVLGVVARFIEEKSDILEERVRAGRIIDGHGDLRPEHVCLTDPPVIIDCLEFNRELRLVDPFDELSFLGLECGLLGAGWVDGALYRQCADALADRPPTDLLAFYRAYRACLRARLMLAHLGEPSPRNHDKWMPRALGYLEAARHASLRLRPRQGRRATHPRGNA